MYTRTRDQPKDGLKASWTRYFFIFCQMFARFYDFSKFHSIFGALSTLKKHQIWQKMKKSLGQLAFNPFLHGISGTRNLSIYLLSWLNLSSLIRDAFFFQMQMWWKIGKVTSMTSFYKSNLGPIFLQKIERSLENEQDKILIGDGVSLTKSFRNLFGKIRQRTLHVQWLV